MTDRVNVAAADPRLLIGPGAMIAFVAALWAFSDVGFYFLLPAVGVAVNFNTSPVAASFYYFFWAVLTALLFWPAYMTWLRSTAASSGSSIPTVAAAMCVSFLACVFYAAYVLPLLPAITVPQSPDTQIYKMASSIFFLPKSVEILFQQLLFIAVVIALSSLNLSLIRIAVSSALLFGGAHALLALNGMDISYVALFMASATAFGVLFPYLILRVPHGLPIAFTMHWTFYAAISAMLHFTGA